MDILTKSPYIPTMTINQKLVKKTKDQYTHEDFVRRSKNYKAIHILYYGIDATEYNCICACEVGK